MGEAPCNEASGKTGWRQYTRDMLLASLAYAVTIVGAVFVLQSFDPPRWVQVLLALAPVGPALLMLRAYQRQLDRLDEFLRRIQTESLLLAAGIVGFGTFTYGFLQSFAGFPAIPDVLLWVLPAMCMVWGLAQVFVRRRYQ